MKHSKIMKLLIIFNVTAFLFFCLAPVHLYFSPQKVHYYALSEDFTEQEMQIVESAIAHFEESVPCIDFVNISEQTENINELIILDIYPALSFNGNVIGLYRETSHSIYIARFSNINDENPNNTISIPMDEDYTFKITIHELAHALGMSGYPHPMADNTGSHLSATIDPNSSKFLCRKDIMYLRKTICN